MMELALALAAGSAAAAGLYLAMSRDAVSIVVGLAVLGSGANLFVFAVGRLGQAQPPIIPAGLLSPLGPVADPLPQALVLTAIVIGFAVACFGIALALALQRANGSGDVGELDAAEPRPAAGGEPGTLP